MSVAIRSLPRARFGEGATLSVRSLREHAPSLLLSLTPGVVFTAGLVATAELRPDLAWLTQPTAWPWQVWIMGLAGTIATVAGVLDWIYHRQIGVAIGKHERRAELLALGLGGVPLFMLMGLASLSLDPLGYLVPVIAVLVLTTAMVMYDEIAFHRRRCAPVEHLLHRTLTLGHLVAFLAWAHGVFVAGVFHAALSAGAS